MSNLTLMDGDAAIRSITGVGQNAHKTSHSCVPIKFVIITQTTVVHLRRIIARENNMNYMVVYGPVKNKCVTLFLVN